MYNALYCIIVSDMPEGYALSITKSEVDLWISITSANGAHREVSVRMDIDSVCNAIGTMIAECIMEDIKNEVR